MIKKILFPRQQLLTFSLLTLINLILSFQSSMASSTSSYVTDFNVSLGNLCEFIGQYQTDETGKKNTCAFLPLLGVGYGVILNEDWTIRPELSASFPQSGRDPNVKRMVISTIVNAEYKTSFLDLVSGLGLFFTRIAGPGGDALLNNGNSQDSFPLPSDAVYTRNLILNLGANYNFNKDWSSGLYTHVFNLLESEDRSLSVGLKFTYHFGDVI
jgi:hypothetical protein